MKTIFLKQFKRLAVLALTTVLPLTGALMLQGCSKHEDAADHGKEALYTCPMHPSFKTTNPKGKCPICGMNVIPLSVYNAKHGTNAAGEAATNTAPEAVALEATTNTGGFQISPQRLQMIGVTYANVTRRTLSRSIRVPGMVAYDPARHHDFVARVEGYVEDLKVFSRGQPVKKGDPLLTLFSPDLQASGRELISLLKAAERQKQADASIESLDHMAEAARQRLVVLGLSTNQVEQIEQTRTVTDRLTLYSPYDGIVQAVGVDQGRRFMPGDHLVDITDLTAVWVWADFYQDDLHFLAPGTTVEVTMGNDDHAPIKTTIKQIDPYMDGMTRTARVKLELANPDLHLKPDMFVSVSLALTRENMLAVPATALLPSGAEHHAFVALEDGHFEVRVVQVTGKFGDYFAVISGLKEGERVVNSANFLIDAESRLQGALKDW